MTRPPGSVFFSFEIKDPKNINQRKIGKAQSQTKNCSLVGTEDGDDVEDADDGRDPGGQADSESDGDTVTDSDGGSGNQTKTHRPPPLEEKNKELDQDQNSSQMTLGIIIGASVLVSIIVLTVVVRLVYSKKEQLQKPADVNPVYDGAADYEYEDDNEDNYDTMEVSTRRKKEVKAEVVDRSSIYGEKEEGWEDAVVIDENPNYEATNTDSYSCS